jgi:hypothetical protein
MTADEINKLAAEAKWLHGEIMDEFYTGTLRDHQMLAAIEALRLAALRPSAAPAAREVDLPPLSENTVLHAVQMAQTDAHKQGDRAFWFAFAERLRVQWGCMLPVTASSLGVELTEDDIVDIAIKFFGWDMESFGPRTRLEFARAVLAAGTALRTEGQAK